VAAKVYEEAGFSPERAAGHLDGIDFNHPVTLETLQPGKVFEQQMLGGNKGNYFTEVGTAPETVGINPAGRVPGAFTPTEPIQALRSTASPIVDTWTTPGQPYQTMGGGTQLFVPNKALMAPVGPGGVTGAGSVGAAMDAQAAARANFVGPTIGKSGFQSMRELSDAAYTKYQALVDQGYTNALQDLRDGTIRLRPGVSENTVLGARTDKFARDGMKQFFAGEGISEGVGRIAQLNRYLRDPSGTGAYRIPDLSIPGANQIFDASLASKSWSLPQVQGFYNYSGGSHVTIVRPIANPAGGSYSLLPHN
jgi:hypothetical protein